MSEEKVIKASGKFAKLTEQIIERTKDLDYVESFWLCGSRAIGKEREDSDINYGFLVSSHSDYSKLKTEFKDLISWRSPHGFYPEQHWEVGTWKDNRFTFKDIVFNIFVRKDLIPYRYIFSEKISNNRQRHLEPFQETHLLEYQGSAQHIFVNSVVAFDKENMIHDLKNVLTTYPGAVSRGVKNWALGRLNRRMPWHGEPWYDYNKFQFLTTIKEDLYYIAIAHYAANKKFMENGLKHYEEDLKTFEPDLREEVEIITSLTDKKNPVDKREAVLEILRKLNQEKEESFMQPPLG